MELSGDLLEPADLFDKLRDKNVVLTSVEKTEANFLIMDYINVWAAAHAAYRNGLIAPYLYDLYLNDMAVTFNTYPGLAVIISEVYEARWGNVAPGQSLLLDTLKGILLENGLTI
ncbi:MAG TPA: hypothetical protein QGI39_05410 [Gammaproteobacteria bacterium]|nr:hypothetical protein [Gammaproteobacteria bacterium]